MIRSHSLEDMLDTTIRQSGPPEEPPSQPWSGLLPDDPAAVPGSTVVETSENGDVTITFVEEQKPERDNGFDANLALLPELASALPIIAEDVIQGVEADEASQMQFMESYTRGLELLGLTLEDQSRTKGQKRKTASVRDTTLLESVVKAQSQARGELLPAAGPAKVTTTAGGSEQEDQRAADFESDFNLALTKGMPEYVPDLDRGLFGFFYGGNMFRYGYIDPLLGRPAVATVATQDMIVSEEAVALDTATRWTIRIPEMAPGEVRRRQFYGIWRDVDLGSPMPTTNPVSQKLGEIAGKVAMAARPQDQPYTIYHTVTNLDLAMHGYEEKGAPRGLPLPYRVTTEKYSRQVLRIERFWKQGDKKFNRKRRCVHYGMVPGFGFMAYGFLQLQGNQVSTLTAIVRLLIDAMMFGQFPGGMKIKGVRTDLNEVEPGPGEWVDVGVPGGVDDIHKVVMAMPYKDLNAVSIELYKLVQQATARVGAAAMLEVGEGRANVPVGTIMAMLEEKSVVMSAVHKRLHEAMGQELSMLKELFAERPETLAEVLESPRRQWAAPSEFQDLNLVPASDPNVPSQVHRVMLATALATLLSMPNFAARLDQDAGLRRVLRMIGISDADSLVTEPAPQTDPTAAAAQATVKAKEMDVAARAEDNRRKAAHEVVETQQQERESQREAEIARQKMESDERIAGMKEETEMVKLQAAQERAKADVQQSREEVALDHMRAAADREERRQFGGAQL